MEDESVGVRRREDFPALLERPGGRRVTGDVDVNQSPASDLHHDKDTEDSERRGHRDAEVAGHDGLRVVPNEGGPSLPGRATPSPTGPAGQAAHGARRDAKAELDEEFRGNPLLAPGGVAPRHHGDQSLEIRREARPSRTRPPAPEQAKGFTVPLEEGRGLDDRQGLAPGETSGQQYQSQPSLVRCASGLHLPLAVERQLLPEEEVLGHKGRLGPETHPQGLTRSTQSATPTRDR